MRVLENSRHPEIEKEREEKPHEPACSQIQHSAINSDLSVMSTQSVMVRGESAMILDAFQMPCTFVMVKAKAAAAETRKNRYYPIAFSLDYILALWVENVC
jgi:hypothetical protein